ncbi:MAG: class I SAM-dependent methyltransferase [Bacteroidota bacterium]
MKVAGGKMEDGVIIGNTYDKYGSKNPIVRLMMQGYENSLNEFVTIVNPTSIHEVGCGEGYWSLKWLEKGIETLGSDFSNTIISMAKSNAMERNLNTENFIVRDIYNLDPNSDTANLVVCCQVLEHLENPIKALEALRSVAKPYVIICVPNEPLWSILNMARGKYLSDCGNTPGHIQKWSKNGLLKFVSQYFEVINVNLPMPWTMLLCKNENV